ncbi:hypothetical protein ACIQC7_17520 [Kitasatospora sp. NPDC088556]|uniref:hypothetical protein n=1 Tax=Kitasatospora sp. NPDC088556 TaxID=3364076 RepID=UPI0038179362
MTKNRARNRAVRARRAEDASAGQRQRFDQTGQVVDQQHAAEQAGRRQPPPGVAADPKAGPEYEILTVPLIVATMLPVGREGLEAAQVLADACDYLVGDGGWYRARAEAYGPMPTRESGMAPLPGHRPAMLLVRVSARREWTSTDAVAAFLRHAATAIITALIERYPEVTERSVQVEALPQETAAQMTGAKAPDAVTPYPHRDLLAGPHAASAEAPAGAGHPFRVVDDKDTGWYLIEADRYRADHATVRQLEEMTHKELQAARGPLRSVVPAPAADRDRVQAALTGVGPKALASLLVALYRLARRHAYEENERSGRVQSDRLYAGNGESWESLAMRALLWGPGVDLADKPKRIDENTVTELMAVIDSWVSGNEHYVEVADTLAGIFSRTAAATGGWPALADCHFQHGANFAHPSQTIDNAMAWLLQADAPPPADQE